MQRQDVGQAHHPLTAQPFIKRDALLALHLLRASRRIGIDFHNYRPWRISAAGQYNAGKNQRRSKARAALARIDRQIFQQAEVVPLWHEQSREPRDFPVDPGEQKTVVRSPYHSPQDIVGLLARRRDRILIDAKQCREAVGIIGGQDGNGWFNLHRKL